MLEFLARLEADPRPICLRLPIRFSGALGEVLVEDYPDLSEQTKLDVEGFEIRRELSTGRIGIAQVVDFVAQLCEGSPSSTVAASCTAMCAARMSSCAGKTGG